MPANVFEDGFGTRRFIVDAETGEPVEVLSFAPALVELPAFAPAVGERVARLASARHTFYARVRRLDRPSADALELVSDRVAGWRLSEVLRHAEAEGIRLDVSAAINLLRQLIPAVALFSRHQRDLAIGCIAPERLLLTPQARLVIAEYVLGAAVDKLPYARERLWRDFRVAVPAGDGSTRVTPRADVMGIGLVALSLVLGRPLGDDEFPAKIEELIEGATESSGGMLEPLSAGLKTWLARTLQVEPRMAFATPQEAQVAFEEVLASSRGYVTTPALLEQFVARIAAVAGVPKDVDRAAEPSPSLDEPAPEPAPAEPDARPEEHGTEAAALVSGPETSSHEHLAHPAHPAHLRHPRHLRHLRHLGFVLVVQALLIAWLWTREAVPLAGQGELVIESRPTAARVSIDGEERGVTPLTLRLDPGTHVLELRAGNAEPRVIPLTIRPGVQTAQYIELPTVAATGRLQIQSQPPRARVRVNGQPRGTTPLTLGDLPAGDHEVVVELNGREVKQTVRIEPGGTTQVTVPVRRP